jgi:GGDEF domain-containing protein
MSIYQCGREERYDRITRIVKEVFKVDICQINLLTDQEQLFKSTAGLSEGIKDGTRSPVNEYIRMESHLEIQRLLRTDELTQLKNRKALNEDLKDYDAEYALLFLDIDHFKGINDTKGIP